LHEGPAQALTKFCSALETAIAELRAAVEARDDERAFVGFQMIATTVAMMYDTPPEDLMQRLFGGRHGRGSQAG